METNSSLGFTGAWLDPVSACYPLGNGYRIYLPGLMRFNAPDSFSPFGQGGVNPYSYCAGDPINHSDPSGQVSFGIIGRFLERTFGRRASEDRWSLVNNAEPINFDQIVGRASRSHELDENESRRLAAFTSVSVDPSSLNKAYNPRYRFTLDEHALPSGYKKLSPLGVSSDGSHYGLFKEPLNLGPGETGVTPIISNGIEKGAMRGPLEQHLMFKMSSQSGYPPARIVTMTVEMQPHINMGRQVLTDETGQLVPNSLVYSAGGSDEADIDASFYSSTPGPGLGGHFEVGIKINRVRVTYGQLPSFPE